MIDFRDVLATSTNPSKALSSCMEKASAEAQRTYTPPIETGVYADRGPNARQGEILITRDDNADDFKGKNRLVFPAEAVPKSNTRLIIDSGVAIVYGLAGDGQILNWNGVKNVTITLGDAEHGTAFFYDGAASESGAARRRFVNLLNVQWWLLEDVESRQRLGSKGNVTSGSAVFPFHGENESKSPRDGIYRRHQNSGSPSGYGPNQIASAYRVTGTDIDTDGGTALRLETDGNASGVHHFIGRRITGANGNRVLAMSAHDVNSDHVDVRQLQGKSMWHGIRIAGGPGKFTDTTVLDGWFEHGTTAQDPSVGGEAGRHPSNAVISNAKPPGTQVVIADVGYQGFDEGNRGKHENPPVSISPYNPDKVQPGSRHHVGHQRGERP